MNTIFNSIQPPSISSSCLSSLKSTTRINFILEFKPH
ncbi:hypothetical protein NC652_025183 [Populus alba x Populus x berolinensis]|uniref:Uncharacterized protein n=1 Tax=Populus alba x Populus x berolinensis TaxID=444605 RepID=A0AAD6M845_9ROSI|nr:hypothetical protein NC652_024463 [Populus alba x Populus x berolinensis]KAJ6898581.1 hypothetical protein NC652_025181 [Populus alba x Populus x berolinensis]KAJ6898584.1 hypothetical protein NC652_025183 [Populus alba x Populus x berolinensis]KAJ6980698.1 hypothetical protein NC653_024141 [Populus alba x Populus x berolinensis]